MWRMTWWVVSDSPCARELPGRPDPTLGDLNSLIGDTMSGGA